jgi:hypothetical protein
MLAMLSRRSQRAAHRWYRTSHMRVLVTGSAGLIGSELGADFFGQEGATG